MLRGGRCNFLTDSTAGKFPTEEIRVLNIVVLPLNFPQSGGFSAPNVAFWPTIFGQNRNFQHVIFVGWGGAIAPPLHDASEKSNYLKNQIITGPAGSAHVAVRRVAIGQAVPRARVRTLGSTQQAR